MTHADAAAADRDAHRLIQATAEATLATGKQRWSDIESMAHFGRDYADSEDPRAVALRQHPHGLDWFALALPGTSMWDLHAGVVVADGRASIGVHRAADTAKPSLATLADAAAPWGGDLTFSEVAQEHQVNVVRWPVADVVAEEAAHVLLAVYTSLRELVDPRELGRQRR